MAPSVFVVDDDASFRLLAHAILSAVGLDVAGEADTAASAIAAVAATRPAAVLVDVGLPDRDGISLARELADLPWRPRIVLTSTDPEAATANQVADSGALAFVPKDQLPNAPLYDLLAEPVR